MYLERNCMQQLSSLFLSLLLLHWLVTLHSIFLFLPLSFLDAKPLTQTQVSQCALPFASPGHLRGLTLARLFERVLAVSAPDLFLSSFNEHIGGRQAPAYGSAIAFNMGLPADPQKLAVWVDTYASEFSRDIEPSVEGGGRVWEVAVACVQLYKAGLTCATLGPGNATNACCSRADKDIFANAWSLVSKDGSDFYVSSSGSEKVALVANGSYVELCSAIPNPSAFCVDTQEKDGRQGPFMLYSTPDVGTHIPTNPIYQCRNKQGHNYLSNRSDCEGGVVVGVLGHAAQRGGLEMLRALRRCLSVAGTPTHALDLPCVAPDPTAPTVLGYVR